MFDIDMFVWLIGSVSIFFILLEISKPEIKSTKKCLFVKITIDIKKFWF